jgi:hypothetical protein
VSDGRGVRVRLVVVLDVDPNRRSPAELREHFLDAIRAAILRTERRADPEILAELWRGLPGHEPRPWTVAVEPHPRPRSTCVERGRVSEGGATTPSDL